ncbi:dephospho-CoA kinase [Emticicia sp. CRIBPO]|uniref:dephospho-CoA kinase n=1 Tax=Emticicia sp. CRIBPO TaxID=2683258 RepID=UPI0014133F27|nr:dephospho-CoA kinase [Emticicia sp. CRIBPO]NBA85075.1 dephospho-CoA kinase [Emticicia sp. CRIBPO]
MLKVGITGGIGSGKSIACKIFSSFGVPVYDADSRARFLIENDPDIVRQITLVFGEEAYQDGKYNRKFISSQVFKDKSLLSQLNQIVHPAVGKDFENWVEKSAPSPYVIKEAALMNAASEQNGLDKVIVVTAPDALRIQRIQQRDPQRSLSEIEAIIKNQKSEKEFNAIADYIVYNDEVTLMIPQILDIHRQILNQI